MTSGQERRRQRRKRIMAFLQKAWPFLIMILVVAVVAAIVWASLLYFG